MKKIHPLKTLRSWMQRHHASLSSFMTNFIATVLGIILTFGTTMWYEHQQKKEMAQALVDRCLSNMELRLENLDGVIETYDRMDYLFNAAVSQPLDSVDDEMLFGLIDAFAWQHSLIIDHSYEKSFSQSVNSHEILGSFSSVIGAGFEYLLVAEEHHAEVNNLKRALRKEQLLNQDASWDQNSIRQYVASTLRDKQFNYFRQEMSQQQTSVRQVHYFLQFFIPEARRLWNGEITEHEFWDKSSARWNEWK